MTLQICVLGQFHNCYNVVEDFNDCLYLIFRIQNYAIHGNTIYHQQNACMTLKESSQDQNPATKKDMQETSVAGWLRILKVQLSGHPINSEIDKTSHLLRRCNKKSLVKVVLPKIRSQFNLLRCYQREQLLDLEVLEFQVLHHYHSHNLTPAVSPVSDISNEHPGVLQLPGSFIHSGT